MAEWLYEDGIGEERAILVERGGIVGARIEWSEGLRPGMVADARLIAKAAGARRGTVRFACGAEALADSLPDTMTEGATLRLRVTRAAIAERGRTKLAQARVIDEAPRPAPSLLEELRAGGQSVRPVRIEGGEFTASGWDDLVEQASSGVIDFPGGSLTISPTPAMTLIDVDGAAPARALALAAVAAVAAALRRLDLGGSVGVDFPSLAAKADRQAVDAALAEALGEWPQRWQGERTAMNGFGFVQLVSRLERPSLVALLARRAEAGARMLLRAAERVREPGALTLTAHPAVLRALRPEWLDQLARRTGRPVLTRDEPGLAPLAGFAQATAI